MVLGERSSAPGPLVVLVASPGPFVCAAGRGARELAPDPADIQAELAVVGKAGDPLADNGGQLLMPSRRQLLCDGAFQEKLEGVPSFLAG